MKIETPFEPSVTKIMLLGAGELGKEMILALQQIGIPEIIAVDQNSHAPGFQVAHHTHIIDMANAHALHELVTQEQPHIIMLENEAIATETLVKLEQEGITKVIPTARAAFLTMNRKNLRQWVAEKLDLPTSRYAFAHSYNELQMQINLGIGYPCIVKPIISSSGKGHLVVKSAEDVKAAWDFAMSVNKTNETTVIVEEFIQFDYEITLLTIRTFNNAGRIETLFCEPIGYLHKQGNYVESWQPQRMTPTSLHYVHQMAQKLTDDLGGLGIFGVEFFIKGDKVWFNEITPYPHKTGMVTMVTQVQNQFEIQARALFGLSISTTLRGQPGASAIIYSNIETNEVSFEGIDEALQIPTTNIHLFEKHHAFVKQCMGVALANGQNIHEARQRATLAASKVQVC